jgi:exonuclease VII small subunit
MTTFDTDDEVRQQESDDLHGQFDWREDYLAEAERTLQEASDLVQKILSDEDPERGETS